MESLDDILEVVTHEQMDELFREDPTMEADLAKLARAVKEPDLTKKEGLETDESLNYIIDNADGTAVEVVLGYYMSKMSRDDVDAELDDLMRGL